MSTTQSVNDEPMNIDDSWVELTSSQYDVKPALPRMGTPPLLPVSSSGQIEKLLLDAQRESRSPSGNRSNASSNSSSRGSPKIMHSPNSGWPTVEGQSDENALQQLHNMDWIRDWSSRPEAQPRSMSASHFQHGTRSLLSVRKTSVMKSPSFTVRNVTTLVITHACTFILGAAAMLIYLKKYCHWAAAPISSSPVYTNFQFN